MNAAEQGDGGDLDDLQRSPGVKERGGKELGEGQSNLKASIAETTQFRGWFAGTLEPANL
jgi:hypothetical protein